MSEESIYSVWAYNESPEWLAGNAGTPDMCITGGSGMDLQAAHYTRARIALIAPDYVLEIRDHKDRVVTVREIHVPYSNPRLEIVSVGYRPPKPATPRPARRTLGRREG